MAHILYSKLVPGCTAEILGDADSAGRFPAYVYGDHPDYPKVAASIVPEEWSEVELVPVPDGMPDKLYAVVYGYDPAAWKMEVFATEREAKMDTEVRNNAFGIVPLSVARTQMVPVTRP